MTRALAAVARQIGRMLPNDATQLINHELRDRFETFEIPDARQPPPRHQHAADGGDSEAELNLPTRVTESTRSPGPEQESTHNTDRQDSSKPSSSRRLWTCGHCSQNFPNRPALDNHTNVEHKPFRCLQCGRKFANYRGASHHAGRSHPHLRNAGLGYQGPSDPAEIIYAPVVP